MPPAKRLASGKVTVDGLEIEQVKYRPYDLRHFFASMLSEKKVNLKTIESLMGHTNIETTLNVYGHLLEDAERDNEQKVGLISGCFRGLVAYLWQPQLNFMKSFVILFHGVQGVASSNLVTPTIFKSMT